MLAQVANEVGVLGDNVDSEVECGVSKEVAIPVGSRVGPAAGTAYQEFVMWYQQFVCCTIGGCSCGWPRCRVHGRCNSAPGRGLESWLWVRKLAGLHIQRLALRHGQAWHLLRVQELRLLKAQALAPCRPCTCSYSVGCRRKRRFC